MFPIGNSTRCSSLTGMCRMKALVKWTTKKCTRNFLRQGLPSRSCMKSMQTNAKRKALFPSVMNHSQKGMLLPEWYDRLGNVQVVVESILNRIVHSTIKVHCGNYNIREYYEAVRTIY